MQRDVACGFSDFRSIPLRNDICCNIPAISDPSATFWTFETEGSPIFDVLPCSEPEFALLLVPSLEFNRY